MVVNNGAALILSNVHVIHQNGTALQLAFPNSQLTLENSWAHFSDLGIGVYSGASLVVDATSRVAGNQNTSATGGGIHCELPGSSAFILGTVALNQSESGAGLYATDGCEVVLAGARFEGNQATNGGGAIYLKGGAQLTALTAGGPNIFTGNSAERGGAIYATDPGTTLELDNAFVNGNDATYGGGLYTKSSARATLNSEVDVFDNSATSQGGGVAANSGSIVSLRDGVSVFGNNATDGGGFYLASGAHLNGSANGLEGIEIRDNEATYGGGLYLTGEGTDAVLYNYKIWSNQAQTAGGGAAVRYGAYFEMNRGNSIPCAAPPRCSQLRNNVLTQGTDGSALYLDNGARAKLYQTYIEYNHHQLHSATSRVVQARDDGTTLRLEGVQFWENDGTYLIGPTAQRQSTPVS